MGLFFTGLLAFLETAFFMVGYISNNSLFPEPLTAEEEKIYLEKLANGDEIARNILIEKNLRLVAHVCKKYNIPNSINENVVEQLFADIPLKTI